MQTQSIVVNGQESADQAPQLNKGNTMSSSTLSGKDWSLGFNLATGRKCVTAAAVIDLDAHIKNGITVTIPEPIVPRQLYPSAQVGCLVTQVKVKRYNDIPTVPNTSLEGFWGGHGFNSKHVSYKDIVEQQEEFSTIPGYSVNNMRGR